MIDYFALALTHALILIAMLRMLVRPDLDREDPMADEPDEAPEVTPRQKRRARRAGKGAGDA